jgi:hypothetical protein
MGPTCHSPSSLSLSLSLSFSPPLPRPCPLRPAPTHLSAAHPPPPLSLRAPTSASRAEVRRPPSDPAGFRKQGLASSGEEAGISSGGGAPAASDLQRGELRRHPFSPSPAGACLPCSSLVDFSSRAGGGSEVGSGLLPRRLRPLSRHVPEQRRRCVLEALLRRRR